MKFEKCRFCETPLEEPYYEGSTTWKEDMAPVWLFPVCIVCAKKLNELLEIAREEKP